MTVFFLSCCFSVANHSISVCVCVCVCSTCWLAAETTRWQSLNATETRNQHHRPLVDSSSSHSCVFPCILSALQWISQREDLDQSLVCPLGSLSCWETQATSLCWRLAACAWWEEGWNIWNFHLTHWSSDTVLRPEVDGEASDELWACQSMHSSASLVVWKSCSCFSPHLQMTGALMSASIDPHLSSESGGATIQQHPISMLNIFQIWMLLTFPCVAHLNKENRH